MEIIKTMADLLKMKRKGEYELVRDIDAEGQSVKCLIGDFSGRLNGNGHKIKNLRISDEIWGDEQTLALFYSMSRAEIRDISFENLLFNYDRTYYSPRVAVLAGICSNSTIKNVSVRVSDRSGEDITLVYEANDCIMQNNKIVCNGKEVPVAKYS